MPRQHVKLILAAVLAAPAPAAFGQKATELYIPIGKSPGLSGKVTAQGRIECLEPLDRSISVTGRAQKWTATFTQRTRIYLDRTGMRRSNRYGAMADCQPGLFCEIKYEGTEGSDAGAIEWIKIRVTEEPGSRGLDPLAHGLARAPRAASPPRRAGPRLGGGRWSRPVPPPVRT